MPTEILRYIVREDHRIKRILWAAIGDVPESWFYAFELKDGHVALLLGDGAPEALVKSFDYEVARPVSLVKTLRVQFGNDGSFMMWSQSRCVLGAAFVLTSTA
jgi:hypothetical protein